MIPLRRGFHLCCRRLKIDPLVRVVPIEYKRRTALALCGEIQAAGYARDYTPVTDFIRKWRDTEGGHRAPMRSRVSAIPKLPTLDN